MGKLVVIALVVIVAIGAFFVFRGENEASSNATSSVWGQVVKNKKAQIVNNWFPKISAFEVNKNANDVSLSAKSAIIVNYDTGEVIFAKNAKERLPVASTVKIMTALVALENSELNDVFVVSEKASAVGENSMGLVKGEVLTLRELLYGMMLVSGNDAAVTVAEGIVQGEENFVSMMNEKAKAIGAGDTVFINATGLDEDGRIQYSTAYDLATIARYTWENYSEFRKIASTDHIILEENSRHKAFDLYNDTNLLTTYPGVKGIKPGFTWEAGLCLVTYAQNNGKKLLAVILGSEDRRGEMVKLLDYGFAKYGIKVEHPGLDL